MFNIAGHISTIFNSMGNIQVGGKVPKGVSRSRIERPFAGVITGLSINRLRILDLAAERDPQITIRGDVQLVTGVLDRNDLQRMQQVRFLNEMTRMKRNYVCKLSLKLTNYIS
jgi:leucine-rich repeat transmembrane neuronal protein 1/2